MNGTVSGTRLRKELGKQLPAHRISVSDSGRYVQVEADSAQDVCYVVSVASREAAPVFPVPCLGRIPPVDGWHIRLSLSRLSAITDFSPDSGLVCVQCGTGMQRLSDWLAEKGFALGVHPEQSCEMELWEFMLSAASNSFGPRFGFKRDQVLSLSAVLPNGRLFRNSVSPARSTGPDFSLPLLHSAGRFGLPLEIYLRIHPLPAQRVFLTFALDDLPAAVERTWEVASAATPELIEIGVNRLAPGGLPQRFVLVELWGEGKALSVRKELVRKLLGDVARPSEVPYEMLLAFEKTYRFVEGQTRHVTLSRDSLKDLVEGLPPGGGPVTLRIRGFVDGLVSVTAGCNDEAECAILPSEESAPSGSRESRRILDAAAGMLDGSGVFMRLPEMWGGRG
ncbi:MAG: FAD-binding oxidoreductase [Deltaproteobacteria bacterium]|nr:FAD-binding oxidoreductase [Deltaproteobacteria bacterium]